MNQDNDDKPDQPLTEAGERLELLVLLAMMPFLGGLIAGHIATLPDVPLRGWLGAAMISVATIMSAVSGIQILVGQMTKTKR